MSRVEAFKSQPGSKLNQLIKAPFWETDQGIMQGDQPPNYGSRGYGY